MTAEPILYFSAEKRPCAVNIGLLQHFLRGHFVAVPFWAILNFVWQIHSGKSQPSLNILIGWRHIRPLKYLSHKLRRGIKPHHDWFPTKMVVMVLAARTEACFWAILWWVFVADIHGGAFCGDWIFHMLAPLGTELHINYPMRWRGSTCNAILSLRFKRPL